jgi:hypothetical protein
LKSELIEKAISELEAPTLQVTEQYLEVLHLEQKKGKPKIERVDSESFPELNVIYFAIKDEPFFLSVYISKETNEITNVGTENAIQVYLTATSENLTYEELSELIKFKDLTGWSVNELRPKGKSRYNFSRLSYEPIKSRAYDLESKLKLLLTDLETDLSGVKKLVEKADTYISIHCQQYIDGNKGIRLDRETIERISKLNLAIDFDQYVFGNELK